VSEDVKGEVAPLAQGAAKGIAQLHAIVASALRQREQRGVLRAGVLLPGLLFGFGASVTSEAR
jgi:hypothetical protein